MQSYVTALERSLLCMPFEKIESSRPINDINLPTGSSAERSTGSLHVLIRVSVRSYVRPVQSVQTVQAAARPLSVEAHERLERLNALS